MEFNNEENENINIKDVLNKYLKYWYWFIICTIISLFCAFYYLRYTPKQYNSNAKILLNNSQSSVGELAGVIDITKLGSTEADGEITDQIEIIKSRRILEKVIKKNNYNISYFNIGKVIESEISPEDSPIKIIVNSDTPSFTINVKIESENKFSINGKEYTFGQSINDVNGNYKIVKNNLSKNSLAKNLIINISSIENSINKYAGKIKISPNGKDSKIINLSMTGTVPEISEKFINDLIDVYNSDIILDNTKLTISTSEFINNKLNEVTEKLKGFDSRLQNFKTDNKFTDLNSEANLFIQNASENEKKLLQATTQLSLVDAMRNSLSQNKTELLPTNIGLDDQTISKQISEYNQLVLTKNEMLNSSTEEHPNVIRIQEQIYNIKSNLKTSLNLYRNSIQTQTNKISSNQSEIDHKISLFPSQEKELKDITREQKIIEALFLFLLQKKEENEIKEAATPDYIKIIDYSYSSKSPVAPKKNIIFLGALIIGSIIPFAIIYIFSLFDNKVKTKEDILRKIGNANIIGQIPHSTSSIIKENDFSTISESLRILRTNIDYNLRNIKNGKCIFITSTISNEGKTFVSSNLTKIFSETNKKVLLIGTDLRNPKILNTLDIPRVNNQLGLTEYLYNSEIQINDIITKNPKSYNFDIINSGKLSPNPTELLMNNRFDDLIKEVREIYDYIIVDTVPVGVVTDMFLISENADLTLYIIRANTTEIADLDLPKELLNINRLKNMQFALNDVSLEFKYGFGYYSDVKLPWYKKILNRFKK